ncbi:MAG: hypothetical protein A2Y79_13520 [Deltaproteobacteria bacterium RBG_13_43_22]|nr:MAG: hypothetical protein A2Y79_13520 [Deltaproteobacteria bacterium RBG_13_43_22]
MPLKIYEFKAKGSRLKAERKTFPSFYSVLFFFTFLVIFPPFQTIYGQPLRPEQAFSFQALVLKTDLIEIRFQIAPGYYLYRNKFQFQIEPIEIKPTPPQMPAGQVKEDPNFGRMDIFRSQLVIILPLIRPPKDIQNITLYITYQGCSDAGFCYPPKTKKVQLKFPARTVTEGQELKSSPPSSFPLSAGNENGQGVQVNLSGRIEGAGDGGDITRLFLGNSFFWIVLSFFGFGLLLCFTPCVLPMVPIISGIILAQGEKLTKKRSFSLSLTYVLGMALTYSAAGIAAGFSGRLISSALQNPFVLTAFALIFVALSLSMFGIYELQLPGFIQTKLMGISNRFKAGTFVGVFLMGLLSAIMVSPCVTAPLSGALLYISRTKDVWLGGSALFSLALGMGVPLLIIGTSAGVLFPKAGLWMKWVKVFFGIILLAVAFWIIYPIVSPPMPSSLSFQRLTQLSQVDSYIKEADGRSIMLYVSADWCVSCREMDILTFRDPRVKEKLKGVKLLKADVTRTGKETDDFLKRFGLFGPPAVLFFDDRGQEIPGTRVIGVQKPTEFLVTLKTALSH